MKFVAGLQLFILLSNLSVKIMILLKKCELKGGFEEVF
jgi:hypothetical protein